MLVASRLPRVNSTLFAWSCVLLVPAESRGLGLVSPWRLGGPDFFPDLRIRVFPTRSCPRRLRGFWMFCAPLSLSNKCPPLRARGFVGIVFLRSFSPDPHLFSQRYWSYLVFGVPLSSFSIGDGKCSLQSPVCPCSNESSPTLLSHPLTFLLSDPLL